ncbi:MAG: hypothetical protein AAGF11_36940 [Myxococcota bacterium]
MPAFPSIGQWMEHGAAIPPMVVDLGKQKKKRFKDFSKDRGSLREAVDNVAMGVAANSTGEDVLVLPVVVVYKRKQKKKKRRRWNRPQTFGWGDWT